MLRTITKPPKKEKSTKNIVVPIILIVTTILVLTLIISCIKPCISENPKRIEDYFVEYENASILIDIFYDYTILGEHHAVGFIDDNIYNQYIKNSYQGKIKIYHPYQKGECIIIDTNDIRSIQTLTYENFYNEHPPK